MGKHGLKKKSIYLLGLQTEHLTCIIDETIKLLSKMNKKHYKWHFQYFLSRLKGEEFACFI